MKIKLSREVFTDKSTIGQMFIDGKYFCDTLEDKNRDENKNGIFDNGEVKIYGETAIPYGNYDVTVSYSNAFKRELPLLLNVPHFEGIRIHRGNKPEDTKGCILVGEYKETPNWISNSTPYEIKLTGLIKEAISAGHKVTINII